jgi:serine protease Do
MEAAMRRYAANPLFFIMMSVLVIMAWLDLPVSSPSMAHAMEKDKPDDLTEAVNRVIKENGPAVVHIEVIRREKATFPFWFYEMTRLMKRPEKSFHTKPGWQDRGTGVLIDDRGHILTNYDIAGEAREFQVSQTDSRKFPASFLGADPKTDLAVIRLLAHHPIPHATFGDSDKADIGDRVVTIGYGADQNQVVNQGIITAKPKTGMTDLHILHDLMRVDIHIHPGNTGGPLFNLQGKIVGINSALMTRFSNLEGAGLAIPSSLARVVVKRLIQNGKMERGWLGATVQDVTPYLMSSLGLPRPEGGWVTRVVRGGPADRAGLKTGDVITVYRDQKVLSAEHLQREVAGSTAGEKVRLSVVRDKKRQQISVVIGSAEEMIRDPAFFIRNRLGVDVRPATPKESARYGLPSRQGMVIVGIYPGSPLGGVGFELNDMIMEVEGRPVKGPEDFMDQITRLNRRQRVIMLGLDHRTGMTGFVQVLVP